jgi:hypothetical protein
MNKHPHYTAQIDVEGYERIDIIAPKIKGEECGTSTICARVAKEFSRGEEVVLC